MMKRGSRSRTKGQTETAVLSERPFMASFEMKRRPHPFSVSTDNHETLKYTGKVLNKLKVTL
jgi:hypothetical protein